MNVLSAKLPKFISVILSVICAFNVIATGNYQKNAHVYPKTSVSTTVKDNNSSKNDIEFVEEETQNTPAQTEQKKDTEVKLEETKDEKNTAAPAEEVKNNDAAPAEEVKNDDAAPAEEVKNDDAAPAEEVKNDDAAPAEEVKNDDAAAAEEIENDSLELLETIDISATKTDDVKLSIYSAPKADTASFSMNTVMASTVDWTPADDGTAQVDDSSRARLDDSQDVVAYIRGDGNMEDYIYKYFVDPVKFVDTVRGLLAQEYGLAKEDVIYTLPDFIDLEDENADVLQIDMYIDYFANADGEGCYKGMCLAVDDFVRDNLKGSDILKYYPKNVIFDKDSEITSISDGAFLFCDEFTQIEIPATVKTIGDDAFGYCTGLTNVVMNEGLESIGMGAFAQCRSLERVVLPSTVKYIGNDAFASMKAGSIIYCPTQEVYNLVNVSGVYSENRTTVVAPQNNEENN